jgi:Holin of 3TMs, for gene-transfer release
MGLLDFIPIIGKIFDRVLPDKAASEAAKLKVMELAQTGNLAELDAEVKLAQAQTDVNKVEAASPSVFVAGWRPFIGWVCGLGMASTYVFGPFVSWIAALLGHPTQWPQLDIATLMSCLMGMLGLGTLRTYEKKNGVA